MENEKPFQKKKKKSEKCKLNRFELKIWRLFEKADDGIC